MKLEYRPEIDGLRAIAVSIVILYHSQITILGYQPFKGGFIGVDIFFVISGYLITSLILKELAITGSFSLKHFYERRVRRILPTLLFVMLASLPFAWMYLLPSNFVDFSKSILYSLVFISNFYFYLTGQEYGAESGFLKPFLHTWSLSVEEQFYILFPIVLLIIFKYFRKYLIHILLLGFTFSLGLADWGSRNHPSFNFYALPTRVWELLAGSILAYLEITSGYSSKHKILNLILPSFGFLLICHSVIFFNEDISHPSFNTLSTIIGVCLIICFSNKNEIITKILSSKLFVGIGLISYSLYLWHYPIFAFAREIQLIPLSAFEKFLLIFLTILLSIFSYFFIEKPFRNNKNQLKSIFFIIITFYLILFTFNFYILSKKGFKYKFSYLDEPNRDIFEGLVNKNVYNKNFSFEAEINKSNIFLVGDSHAETISYSLWKKLSKNYNMHFSIFGGCQFILNLNRVLKKNFKPRNCSSSLQKRRLDFINQTSNSIVILFGRLSLILNEDRFNNFEYGFYEGKMSDFLQNENNTLKTKLERQESIKLNYQETVKKLLENNHKIILVYPVPEVGISVSKIFRNKIQNRSLKLFSNHNLFTTSFEIYNNRNNLSFKLLDSIKGDNIFRVYPHLLFCDNIVKDRCITHDNENIFYSDDDHPSLRGAELITNLILKKIEEIEKTKN